MEIRNWANKTYLKQKYDNLNKWKIRVFNPLKKWKQHKYLFLFISILSLNEYWNKCQKYDFILILCGYQKELQESDEWKVTKSYSFRMIALQIYILYYLNIIFERFIAIHLLNRQNLRVNYHIRLERHGCLKNLQEIWAVKSTWSDYYLDWKEFRSNSDFFLSINMNSCYYWKIWIF